MKLRLASSTTKTLDLGEGGELYVKTDISKRDFNELINRMPQDMSEDSSFTPKEANEFTIGLFSMLVTGWNATSLSDVGEDIPVDATVENYLSLQREAATAIDTALVEHFNALTPTREEKTKSPKAR